MICVTVVNVDYLMAQQQFSGTTAGEDIVVFSLFNSFFREGVSMFGKPFGDLMNNFTSKHQNQSGTSRHPQNESSNYAVSAAQMCNLEE